MFDPDKTYLATDPVVAEGLHVGYWTLARWRTEGKGPAYIQISGRRVAYLGKDLNAWLMSQRHDPCAENAEARPAA